MDETPSIESGNDLEPQRMACSQLPTWDTSLFSLIFSFPFGMLFWRITLGFHCKTPNIAFIGITVGVNPDIAVWKSDDYLHSTYFSFTRITISRAVGLESIKVKLILCLCVSYGYDYGWTVHNSSVKRLTRVLQYISLTEHWNVEHTQQ